MKSVGFAGFGVQLEVCSADAEIVRKLNVCMPAYRLDLTSPAPITIRADVIEGDVVIVHGNGSTPGVTVSDWDAINHLELMIAQTLLSGAGNAVHLHAAGGVDQGRAVIAIGETGAGKSTLATTWSVAGMQVLGDDAILLEPGGRVLPFKRLFKSNPDVLLELGQDPAGTPLWEPGSEEAWFDPSRHGGWASAATVGVAALLRYREDMDGFNIAEVKPSDMVREMLNGCLASGIKGHDGFDMIVAAVSDSKLVTVEFGPGRDVASALLEL